MRLSIRGLSIGLLAAAGLGSCTEQDASAPEAPAMALVQPPSAEIAGEFTVLKTGDDDVAISAATDGSNYLAAIQAGSNEIVKARLVTPPSTVGTIYSTGKEGDLPLTAFDGTNYLMIWTDQNNSNVLGRRVSTSGTQVGSLVHVTNTADVAVHCGLAFGGGKYVVTFIRNDGLLYRRFVSPTGQLLGPAKAVSTSAAGCRYLNHVATDGTDFLATWWDYVDQATVMARLVRGDGTLGPLRTVNNSPEESDFPVGVAFNGGQYFVLWGDRITSTKWDLYGRLMTAAGGFAGPRFLVQGSAVAKFPGPVTPSGSNFAVAYMDNLGDPPNATVKVRFFNSSGSALMPSQTVFRTPSGGKVPIVGYMGASGSSFFFLILRGVPGTNAYDYDLYSGWDLDGSFKTVTP